MTNDVRGLRVLVVEDDYNVAEAFCAILQEAGVEVVGPVATVEAALELAKTRLLDAAILDIALSPGTSAPVARALLSRECHFVFVTGFSHVDMLPAELRGHRVLVKPVDAAELRAAIHEAVRSVA